MLNRTQEEIIQKWPKDWNTPLVSVRCITYNQQSFIAQTLDGFLSQETDFPFEVIVHDVASTDKTADVIREYEKKYPKIIKPIYETENQYSKNDDSLDKIVDSACKGKYIAFCEGDDYWIDPLKLQKQISFLEKNLDYGYSYTNFKGFNQQKQQFFEMNIEGLSGDNYAHEMLNPTSSIWTLTFCCRKELYLSRPKLNRKEYFCGDRLIFLHLASISKGLYLPECTSVYRKLSESASHFKSKRAIFKFCFFHNKTYLYFLDHARRFEGWDKAKKRFSIRLLPYCFFSSDWEAFKKIELSLFPVKFESFYWTIRYLFVFAVYKLCRIKPFFKCGCFLVNLLDRK